MPCQALKLELSLPKATWTCPLCCSPGFSSVHSPTAIFFYMSQLRKCRACLHLRVIHDHFLSSECTVFPNCDLTRAANNLHTLRRSVQPTGNSPTRTAVTTEQTQTDLSRPNGMEQGPVTVSAMLWPNSAMLWPNSLLLVHKNSIKQP